jgi:hypothetical protein
VYINAGPQVLACIHHPTRLDSTVQPNPSPHPRTQKKKMKLILAALTAFVAATMAAPSAEAASVPAVAEVLEARKCLRAGGMSFLSPWRDVAWRD